MFSDADLLIVGAGFYGATIAERAAAAGRCVVVIDKRGHIGGNAYSEIDQETGIEMHRYGAHLFHTSSQDVWDYISRFTQFTSYQHRVFINRKNVIYTMPINLGTICQFFGRAFSPSEARDLLLSQGG